MTTQELVGRFPNNSYRGYECDQIRNAWGEWAKSCLAFKVVGTVHPDSIIGPVLANPADWVAPDDDDDSSSAPAAAPLRRHYAHGQHGPGSQAGGPALAFGQPTAVTMWFGPVQPPSQPSGGTHTPVSSPTRSGGSRTRGASGGAGAA